MRFILYILFAMALHACSHVQPGIATASFSKIESSAVKDDSATTAFIKPYKHLYDSLMGKPIGYLAEKLEKGEHANTLWNFSADILLSSAPEIFNENIHAAFINGGGLRTPYLAKGALTRGKIFELMPFENYVMLVKLKGTQVQKLADHIIRKKGEPVAGMLITGQTSKSTADLVMIDGMVLDTARVYNIATLDFVALYAGIGAFENADKKPSKVLYREVIEKHALHEQRQGKLLTAKNDARVILY